MNSMGVPCVTQLQQRFSVSLKQAASHLRSNFNQIKRLFVGSSSSKFEGKCKAALALECRSMQRKSQALFLMNVTEHTGTSLEKERSHFLVNHAHTCFPVKASGLG
jgi:hypothetical protein